jgi:hypothetical protein
VLKKVRHQAHTRRIDRANQLETLCTLYEQDDNPFNRTVLHVLAGTFFLGTPHPTYYRQHSWPQHLNLLLQSSLKLSKRRLIQTELQTDLIVSLSFNFQNAGIDIPVFSIHETKATKVQIGLFQSRKIVVRLSILFTLLY